MSFLLVGAQSLQLLCIFFFCISTVISFWHHPEMTRSIRYQKIILSFKKGILWIYSSISVLSSFIQFCMLSLKILEMHCKSYSLVELAIISLCQFYSQITDSPIISNCSVISGTVYSKVAERSMNGKENTLTEESYLVGSQYPFLKKNYIAIVFFLKQVIWLMELKSCKPWPLWNYNSFNNHVLIRLEN